MSPAGRALGWGAVALGLWLACTLPNLDRNRLQDSDELAYAGVAKSAAVDGQWWPLISQGRVFYEKPPLQLWLAAATVGASGRPLAAWPYRLWNDLGAGLALASLVGLAALLGRPWAGWAAAALLALQGDWLFHARFFTFDTPFVGLALAALAAGVWAAQGPAGRWWLSGTWLALAVWIKSWFVLALAPAWVWALWAALPPGQRRGAAWRLALPVAAALLLWLALYVDWNGWGFLAEEWNQNLMGRALGRVNVNDPEGLLAYYLKWSQRSSPALLPLALAVPLGLWPGRRDSGPAGEVDRARRLALGFAWAFCVSWLLGLGLQRAETINYLLPLEAGLALALGLAVDAPVGQAQGQAAAVALLLLACAASSRRWWPPLASLALGLPLGGLWLWSRGRKIPGSAGLAWAALAGLLLLLLPEAAALETRPLDGSAQLAALVEAHPARRRGEPLLLLGPATLAADFYSDYAVTRPSAPPAQRPPQACVVDTQAGWIFYPAQDALPGRK